MGDTAPLRLPVGTAGASDEADATRIGSWIERLIAAGVEPRCELLITGVGLADAALAAARLVGPRGRVVAVAATEREAAELRDRAATSGAGQIEVALGLDSAALAGRPVSLALQLAACGSAGPPARFEGALARGGRSLVLVAPG
jgi:hypothetical protein